MCEGGGCEDIEGACMGTEMCDEADVTSMCV